MFESFQLYLLFQLERKGSRRELESARDMIYVRVRPLAVSLRVQHMYCMLTSRLALIHGLQNGYSYEAGKSI